MRDDAIGLSEFTEPMRALITECASEGSGQGAEWFVCSAKPLEHGLEIAERDADQFEAGEPEADGAFAGDPRVDDLADGLDVDLAADGVLGCAVGLVVLVAIPITLGVASMVAVLGGSLSRPLSRPGWGSRGSRPLLGQSMQSRTPVLRLNWPLPRVSGRASAMSSS
jgi:hypothetical protein